MSVLDGKTRKENQIDSVREQLALSLCANSTNRHIVEEDDDETKAYALAILFVNNEKKLGH